MDGSLYLVDALNYLFRAFHALPPLTTSKGAQTGAVYGLCQMLLRIEREHMPTHLCVVFDAPGRTFRDDLYPEYKATRPPMPPELLGQIGMVHKVVEAFGLPILSVPGVEADDVVATVARQAIAAGLQVVICSSDKDLMQLCSDKVRVLDTMKNRMLGPAEVQEKFGVPPERLGDVLALMGDGVDNVPGVDGVGPKTAAELIKTFGSLDALMARVSEVKGKKGQAIAAARDAVALSRKLVQLKDDVELPRTLDSLRRAAPDRTRLIDLFRELEFSRMLAQELAAAEASPHPAPAPRDAALPVVPDATAPERAPAAAVATTVVLDVATLRQVVDAVRAAGSCGLAIVADGDEATRAALVGLALCLPGGGRVYIPVGHRFLGAPATLKETEVLATLGPLLADAQVAKHVHDGKFAAVLLQVRGFALAGLASDSLLASYVLDASRPRHDLASVAAAEGIDAIAPRATWLGSGRAVRSSSEIAPDEVAPYLGAEAAAAQALAPIHGDKLRAAGLWELYQTLELPLAQVLARIECRGIRLDVDYLRHLGQEVGSAIQAAESEIHRLAGATFNIASPKQLAEILFVKLGLPIVRRTKTGPSTDADVLEELAALHDVPAKIVEYRMLTKLKGTYIDALPALVNPKTGRLHTTFNQAVAATGRLSSSDPNLQNIPIRTDVGRRIREAFIADPGHRIVSADYSQIELRILAHFSRDPAFVDAFTTGQDIHQRTAAEIFGVPLDQVTTEQRRVAKAINFGLVFGQTDFGLSQALHIPRSQAKAYIASYFERYAGARSYMEQAIADARQTAVVSTLLGRRRPLPEIHAPRAQDRAYAERIARNTPIQGSAADILKLAMIRVDAGIARFPRARLLLTVHDELVFEVDEQAVGEFSDWVRHEMESVYPLRVPLIVHVGSGLTWGQSH